jgi:hypothetical protein
MNDNDRVHTLEELEEQAGVRLAACPENLPDEGDLLLEMEEWAQRFVAAQSTEQELRALFADASFVRFWHGLKRHSALIPLFLECIEEVQSPQLCEWEPEELQEEELRELVADAERFLCRLTDSFAERAATAADPKERALAFSWLCQCASEGDARARAWLEALAEPEFAQGLSQALQELAESGRKGTIRILVESLARILQGAVQRGAALLESLPPAAALVLALLPRLPGFSWPGELRFQLVPAGFAQAKGFLLAGFPYPQTRGWFGEVNDTELWLFGEGLPPALDEQPVLVWVDGEVARQIGAAQHITWQWWQGSEGTWLGMVRDGNLQAYLGCLPAGETGNLEELTESLAGALHLGALTALASGEQGT